MDPDAIARELYEAWRTATPIEPLGQRFPDLTADDAYGIQQRLLASMEGKVVGYKVGLTSAAMQQMLGVDEPDYSGILSTMLIAEGSEIERSALIRPKAEAEIAVVLADPLTGPGVTAGDVESAAAGVAASIEVIDSRIEDWDIGLVDTIADLASTARVVVSGEVVPLGGFDPRLVGCAVYRNDRLAATGAGAAALGSPLEAAAWTVNTLGRHGVTVEAGQVILTGSLHAAFDVEEGDGVIARFDRLGEVMVGFS